MTAYSDYEARAIESDERARAVQGLKDEFLKAVYAGDMDAPATFAPMVTRRMMGMDVRVFPSVWEVLFDAFDSSDSNGPRVKDALRALCAVAYGSEPQVMAARELLDRMAGKWADFAYRGE